jgi:hypothetical protein
MFHQVLSRMCNFDWAEPPQWLVSNFISGIRYMPITFEQR